MDLFLSLKSFVLPPAVCTDNNIFRLHYKVTFAILIGCSILVTARQYVGDPIDCIVEGIPSRIMDTYCWFSSTFTLPNRLRGVVGRDIIGPGLGNGVKGVDEFKYHQYYQWVCFVLSFQAILFYFPRYLWKICENGRMKMLSQDLNIAIVEEKVKNEKIDLLVAYFKENLGQQNAYVTRFIFCECLNFVNVIGQIFLMNAFLGGEFFYYGFGVMSPPEGYDPMERIFPKMTKCTFHRYGASGSIQLYDGLCVLAVNVINEKIYIFLWFWFAGLTVVTGIFLIYRIIIITVPPVRYYVLRARARWTAADDIESISKKFGVGDWFVLYQLCKNIDAIIFKEVCNKLVMMLNNKYDV